MGESSRRKVPVASRCESDTDNEAAEVAAEVEPTQAEGPVRSSSSFDFDKDEGGDKPSSDAEPNQR